MVDVHMRSIIWVTLISVTLMLTFTAIAKEYSELDVVATAMLVPISVYVMLKYVLTLYLGLSPKPLISLDFRYIKTVVINGIQLAVLSLAIDALTMLIYPRTLLSTILSAVVAMAVLYLAKRFFGLKVLRIIMVIAILVTTTLYALGYIKEDSILLL